MAEPFLPTHDEWVKAYGQLKATAGRLAELAGVFVQIETAAKAGNLAAVLSLCQRTLRGEHAEAYQASFFAGANPGGGAAVSGDVRPAGDAGPGDGVADAGELPGLPAEYGDAHW